MIFRRKRALAIAGLTTALAVSTALAAPGGTSRGPSTPTDPYVLPVGDGVSVKSLLTVSDAGFASNGYEMVGIPDGLGLVPQPNGHDLRLLMNHELRKGRAWLAGTARSGRSSPTGRSIRTRTRSRRAAT